MRRPRLPIVAAISDATQLINEARDEETYQITLDPQPVQDGPGEGLGLCIVERLADLLSASVEPESVAG